VSERGRIAGPRMEARLRRALWITGLIAAVLLVLFPLYILVKYSISDVASINTGGRPVPFWPYHPTIEVFRYLFSDRRFYAVVLNSLMIALGSVGLSMALGVPAAFVLARYRVPGRKTLLIGIMSVRLFPDIASVIPVTEFFIKIQAHNTYWGVILAHTLLALPYVIFIAIAAFESIPRDLEEQAIVMGANGFVRFFKVLLPLTVPALVAAAIYTFLLSWDEFVYAYFLLGMGRISTLTLYLNERLNYSPPQNLLAALSLCLSLPVIIFSLSIQKYNTAGMVSGAVK
jgi:ABC-type glycerol-3-phosphate transport system permease component